MRFLLLLSLCFMLTACFETKSTAVVDVNYVLTTSPHAKKAEVSVIEAQQIYQYNLDVIEKKLATYKNKAQAEALLINAANQLQSQLNNFRLAISQSMGDALSKEISTMLGTKYDMVLAKNTILANQASMDITAEAQQLYNAATVTWPPMPKHIDNPELPADMQAAPVTKVAP